MNKIKELRLANRITQAKLASILGVTQSNLSGWEKEKWQPDQASLIKLADYFGVSVDYLLGRNTDPLDAMVKQIGGMPYEVEKNAIPILGRVAAGIPLEAQQEYIGYTYTNLKPANEYFALQVEGESMKNAGIRHGSIVTVHRQDDANDGDIVVALVDSQDATVKRFKKLDNAIVLMPDNPDFQPIVITPGIEFHILGVVKKVETLL
jgi:lexA repressor|nr:MAG TPA: Repressor protein CI [Caudoviricetes sp.]